MTDECVNLLGPLAGSVIPDSWRQLVTNISHNEVCAREWFAIQVDGKLAGVGGIRTSYGRPLYLGPSFVLPEYRGRKFQKELIRARLELAHSRREPVRAQVDVLNTASLRNLLNAGFRVVLKPERDILNLMWEPG